MASAEFARIDRDEVRTLVVTGDIDALAHSRFRAFLADAPVDPPIELQVDLIAIASFEAFVAATTRTESGLSHQFTFGPAPVAVRNELSSTGSGPAPDRI